jgi:hypothetical protein
MPLYRTMYIRGKYFSYSERVLNMCLSFFALNYKER